MVEKASQNDRPAQEGAVGDRAPQAQLEGAVRSSYQHTLAAPVQLAGIGLHTGLTAEVRLLPDTANTGRYFVRTDLGDAIIPAQIQFLRQTILSTELGAGDATIRTVEHLLAALSGLGIDNARIEVNGPEVPLLDGSARPWADQILRSGWTRQSQLRQVYAPDQSIFIHQGESFVAAIPAERTRLTCGIDFSHPVIGQQWHSIEPEEFLTAIASARTFGFAGEIETLRERGLIKGGSLDNALVCGDQGWLNPPLHFANEPARHKLLDLIGDLSLLGSLPRAHVLAYKASHTLHTQLVQRLDLLANGSDSAKKACA
jgi:UDP-3-O-[3-hydroxymyristoyl] N-acetylglucosamine deacetylase